MLYPRNVFLASSSGGTMLMPSLLLAIVAMVAVLGIELTMGLNNSLSQAAYNNGQLPL